MDVLNNNLDFGDRAPKGGTEQNQLFKSNLFHFPVLNPFERHEIRSC
jgi:tellurite resistance-related uncharacterized protein